MWTAGTDPKLMCQHVWVMQVLGTEPKNVKALFRRGKAQLRLGNTDGAATDLGAAHRLAPTTPALTVSSGYGCSNACGDGSVLALQLRL